MRLRLLPPWTRMSGTYLRPKKELPVPLTQGHMRYLLAIGRLHAEEGNGARITDISRALKVSKPSAHRMARRLETLRLVEFAPRGRVYLTAKGCRVAECCQDRLVQLQGLLASTLGLEAEQAQQAALALLDCLPEQDFLTGKE